MTTHPPIKCVPQQAERILFAKVTPFLNFAVPTLPISLAPPLQTLISARAAMLDGEKQFVQGQRLLDGKQVSQKPKFAVTHSVFLALSHMITGPAHPYRCLIGRRLCEL